MTFRQLTLCFEDPDRIDDATEVYGDNIAKNDDSGECPDCGSRAFIADKGVVCCATCGVVK